MFTYKEMKNALIRLQERDELPGFICIAIDVESNFTGSALGSIGDFDEEDLPRVCYDMREFVVEEDDGKKKKAKKDKKFMDYMSKKFDKRLLKVTDLKKKFLKNEWPRFYVRDFHHCKADDIIDTKSKDGRNTEFKDVPALMITMGKGPKTKK